MVNLYCSSCLLDPKACSFHSLHWQTLHWRTPSANSLAESNSLAYQIIGVSPKRFLFAVFTGIWIPFFCISFFTSVDFPFSFCFNTFYIQFDFSWAVSECSSSFTENAQLLVRHGSSLDELGLRRQRRASGCGHTAWVDRSTFSEFYTNFSIQNETKAQITLEAVVWLFRSVFQSTQIPSIYSCLCSSAYVLQWKDDECAELQIRSQCFNHIQWYVWEQGCWAGENGKFFWLQY